MAFDTDNEEEDWSMEVTDAHFTLAVQEGWGMPDWFLQLYELEARLDLSLSMQGIINAEDGFPRYVRGDAENDWGEIEVNKYAQELPAKRHSFVFAIQSAKKSTIWKNHYYELYQSYCALYDLSRYPRIHPEFRFSSSLKKLGFFEKSTP